MENVGLTFLGILLFGTSVFMMLLILVQRGKGGGLTGALGGMGGQSAFGSKAGDVFTRITVITAIIWITLCMVTIAAFNPPPQDSMNAKKNETPAMISTDEDETDENGEAPGAVNVSDTGDASGDGDVTSEDVDEMAEDFLSDDSDGAATDDDSATGVDGDDAPADDSDATSDDSDDGGPSLDDSESNETEADDSKNSDDGN